MRYFCPPSRPVMVALVYVNMNLKANIDARTTGVWALMHNISYIHITYYILHTYISYILQ